jgi:translation initiation factor 1A
MPPPKRGRKGRERNRQAAPLAEGGQEYARVTAMLGNNRVRAMFWDRVERTCRIRGSMRRREWVHVGDVILVAPRDDLAGETADIVFRYQPAEVQRLRNLGEPVHIACDEAEAIMDELVTFEADPADVETAPQLPRRGSIDLPPLEEDFDLDDI